MKKVLFILFAFLATVYTIDAQRVIKGRITDKNGDPVIGANVVAKGTNLGTITDVNGNYSLSVPESVSTLVMSYTGYNNQELALGAGNMVDVTMEEGVLLNETVVTALGISKEERSLGYSVSNLDGSNLTGSGEVNAIQALAAKSSNVNIVSSSGTPGASSKVLLRGVGSFQLNSQPLIVVDNVPYDNSTNTVIGGDYPFNANLQGVSESNRGLDINPADIESVNVLKGPSASALYGSRAANGVILITTKKGNKGLGVNYGTSLSLDKVNKLPEFQSVYGQGGGGGGRNTDGTAKAEGTFSGLNTPNSWGPKIGGTALPNRYDNVGNYFENGRTFSNNLAISGGNDLILFRLSLSNTDQTGIIPNTELNRKTIRLNAGTSFKKLTVGANAAYSLTNDIKAQQGSNLSGIMLPLFRAPESFNLLGGNGEGGYTNADGSQQSYLVNYDNPYWTAYHNTNKGDVGRLTASLNFKYDLAKWINLNYRVGTDVYNDYRQQIFDIGSNNISANGEIWENNFKNEEYIHDLFAVMNKQFNVISTTLTVGTQLNDRKTKNVFARGQNLTVPGFFNLANATDKYTDNSISRRKLAGVFGSLDLGYKSLVYLNLTGRNDWASTFGPNSDGSFFYPSASISFVPSELFSSSLVPFLKLRASFARAGREPNAYTSATYFVNPTFTDGYTDGISFPYLGNNGFSYSNTLGNSQLKPEINTTTEFGLEVRLSSFSKLDLTYYNSVASDLLISRPIANSTGFAAITSNTGEMVNKGIEAELELNLFKSKKFNWDINLNYSKNDNEVTKLAPGVDQLSLEAAFTGIGSYAIVGQPNGAFFGSKWQRNTAGDLVIGANGLPLKEALEGYIGNPFPDWLGGIRNTFSYKGLSLTGLLDIRQGQSLWGGTIGRLNRLGRTKITEARNQFYVIPGVKADGTKNDVQITANQYFSAYLGDGGAAQEQLVFDGSWVRLRELTLSYAIPKCPKVISNMSLFVTGRNIWLDTEYPGVDPETSLTGAGSNIGGFDYFNNPGAKSWIIGLNIGL
jgi:TonB-linked SusC/RagA family outer membrane protein